MVPWNPTFRKGRETWGTPFRGAGRRHGPPANKRHFPKQWRQALIVSARELLEWTIPELR